MAKLSQKNDYTLSIKQAHEIALRRLPDPITIDAIYKRIARKKIAAIKLPCGIRISVSSFHTYIRGY